MLVRLTEVIRALGKEKSCYGLALAYVLNISNYLSLLIYKYIVD